MMKGVAKAMGLARRPFFHLMKNASDSDMIKHFIML